VYTGEKKLAIASKGYFHLYEKEKTFISPYYDDIEDYDDYRKISIIPYNEHFWSCTPLPVYTATQLGKLQFFEEHGTIINFKAFDKRSQNTSSLNMSRLFEHSNLIWGEKERWILKPKMLKEQKVNHNEITRRHSLVPQIILDVTTCEGKLICNTVTVLDVFKTTYNLPHETKYFRFFNIYFDLCELERRKLQKELEQINTTEEIDKKYRNSMNRLDKILKDYKNEVSSGENLTAMLKWNEYIKENLGIDNYNFELKE
jgi:hypothetical protein